MALSAQRTTGRLAARTERTGRPPVTTRADIERVALELFAREGFEESTVHDIAAAAGISRRTFFRYFASKNDVVWGDFDVLLDGLDDWLSRADPDAPMLETLTTAVVRFNAVPAEAVPAHRARMSLILHVPALQAHSTLRYAAWRGVVARFAARCLVEPVEALGPQLVGHVALGAAVAAYEQWLRDGASELGPLLVTAFRVLQDYCRAPG